MLFFSTLGPEKLDINIWVIRWLQMSSAPLQNCMGTDDIFNHRITQCSPNQGTYDTKATTLNPFSAETNFRRQILTSKVDLRIEIITNVDP